MAVFLDIICPKDRVLSLVTNLILKVSSEPNLSLQLHRVVEP